MNCDLWYNQNELRVFYSKREELEHGTFTSKQNQKPISKLSVRLLELTFLGSKGLEKLFFCGSAISSAHSSPPSLRIAM